MLPYETLAAVELPGGCGAQLGSASPALGSTSPALGSASPALGSLVRRLWAFLRHPSAEVRTAALRCFERLVAAGGSASSSAAASAAASAPEWQRSGTLLAAALPLLFQSHVLDASAAARAAAAAAWRALLARGSPELSQVALAALPGWLSLLSVARGEPPPPQRTQPRSCETIGRETACT